MILAFTLSMPGRNSWNGRWSGEERLYCITRKFSGKKGMAKAQSILEHGRYHYSWSDGWRAGIDVREVNSKEAAKLRKQSDGFCGYDWMVNTIVDYDKPMADHEVKEFIAAKVATA